MPDMSPTTPITILFGGTFDPFHEGHLHMLEGALDELNPQLLRIIPTWQSPFKKTPSLSHAHRLGMLEAIAKSYKNVVVDKIEIDRQMVSYSIDTLQTLQNNDTRPQVFLIGSDSFLQLQQWKDAHLLHQYCHFALFSRQGVTTSHAELQGIAQTLNFTFDSNTDALTQQSAGVIYQCKKIVPRISSTEIRLSKDMSCLPPMVQKYFSTNKITLNGIYSCP